MSPDEELAALIASRLIKAGLIEADRRDEVSAKMATGTATLDDWRLWVDLALPGPAVGAGDAED